MSLRRWRRKLDPQELKVRGPNLRGGGKVLLPEMLLPQMAGRCLSDFNKRISSKQLELRNLSHRGCPTVSFPLPKNQDTSLSLA